MKISNFYKNEFVDFAMYDNYRKISSYIDGCKPSMRKVVYVMRVNNITTPIKNSSLSAKVSDLTEYLHAKESLEDVVVGMNQSFAGSNNLNIILPESSFGNRTFPDGGAARYVFTYKAPIMDEIFKKDDNNILIQQEFEGTIIEPKFFVPIIPIILVNGSEGIGNGFAQKILPRNPMNLIRYITQYLKSKKSDLGLLDIYYNGFTGECKNLGDGKWEIHGCIERLNTSMFNITEIPIGISLQQYIKVLDKLEADKVIKSYVDKSEDNKFLFEIRCEREFLKQDDETILDALKLIKRVTENFTCISEKNSIIEFKSVEELLKAYIDIRYEYYSKRRIYLLEKYRNELEVVQNKINFVEDIISKRVIVFRISKDEIYEQLTKKKYLMIDESYDYLLTMRVDSFTVEKIESLQKEKDKIQILLDDVINTQCDELWIRELKSLSKLIKG